MKGVTSLFIVVVMLQSFKSDPMMDQIKGAVASAMLQTALEENAKELRNMIDEKEVARNMIRIAKGKSLEAQTSKRRRLHKRRIINKNDDFRRNESSGSIGNGIGSLSALLGAIAESEASENKHKNANQHRKTLIIPRPLGLSGFNLFNNENEDRDIDESNLMQLLGPDQNSASDDVLRDILGGFSPDQQDQDDDSPPIRRVIRKRRTVKRRRVRKVHKRRIVRHIPENESLSTPDDEKKFEAALINILSKKLNDSHPAKEPTDFENDDDENDNNKPDDDNAPTVIFLKADEQPDAEIFGNDPEDEDKNEEKSNNNSGNLGILGDIISGIVSGSLSKSNKNQDQDRKVDSQSNSNPFQSLPFQMIGGFLSSLFNGLGSKDINEEPSQSFLPPLRPASVVHKVHRIRRVRHSKRVTVRKSVNKSPNSTITLYSDPIDNLIRNRPLLQNLPKINEDNVRVPLLGGMFNKGQFDNATRYPSLGHGANQRPFEPLSLVDFINSPSTNPAPFVSRRRVHRRRVHKRVVNHKRIVTRAVNNQDSLGDLVNSLMANLPQLRNRLMV